MYLARIPASIFYPATHVNGQIIAPWAGIFFLEGFALTVMSAFVFLSLIKERAERRYRFAAEIDGLTTAATRRFFVSQTRDLLARKQAKGALAVIDLDHFKSINDSFGHMGGDRVLQTFGAYVTQRLEQGMVFGRLGGEEFGIFMPDRSDREAGEFVESLRAGVEALEIPFMGNPMRVTISVGLASVRDAGVDFDHLMAAADSALYIAKEEGRNRLRFFSIAMRMHRIVESGTESRVGLAESRLSRTGVRFQAKRA
jgi:diguanylate cyclase (GGDEF)-like protein